MGEVVSPNRRYTCREFEHEVNWKVVSPDSRPGEGTPYDDQCTMLGGLDPHLRAWLDPLGSIFEPGSIP